MMIAMLRKTGRSLLAVALCTVGLGAACSSESTRPPEPGHAILEIVGSSDVLLGFGGATRLAVRYVDQDGVPLDGKIDFAVVGDDGGSQLAATSGSTSAEGVVEVDLAAGQAAAQFEIEASAEGADPVAWSVGVNPDGELDVAGTYRVASQFDVAQGIPGGLGDVVNTIIEMTDDPYDPATWVLDQAVASIGSSLIRNAIQLARPALDGLLNDLIVAHSPDVVARLIDLGDKLGQVTTRFGTETTLAVSEQGSALAAVHTMTGYAFTIDGTDYHYAATDLGEQPAVVDGVVVTVDGGELSIGQHVMPLRYGGLLALALEDVIVPLVDPSATGLEGLLGDLVDCDAIGAQLADQIGFGSAGLYAGACQLGLHQGAGLVLARLRGVDEATPVSLEVSGRARLVDSNHDLAADRLLGGTWRGMIDVAGSQSPLEAETSTFSGERTTGPSQ